jgi:hypothetical protein
MSATIASNSFSSAPNIGSEELKAHPTRFFPKISVKPILKSRKDNRLKSKSTRVRIPLQICIPDFKVDLTLSINELKSEMESGEVILKVAIDSNSNFVLTLIGELSRGKDKFQIKQVSLNIETNTRSVRSDFVLASLRVMLSLAEDVYLRIPEFQLDLGLKFEEPLLDISQMLRRRQIAYRIMTIERATGYEFQLPLDISGEEVKNITLIYYAVIHRSFDWPIDSITVFFPATTEWLDRLVFINQFSSFTLGPDPITKTLFGKEIFLGEGTVRVENKLIENFDKVQQELAYNDGHPVAVVIRSLIGHGMYDLPEAPRLPNEPWDEKIQRLVDLEDQLDAVLVRRYHALAASTLEGLTEEEKAAITARPELNEKAFLD